VENIADLSFKRFYIIQSPRDSFSPFQVNEATVLAKPKRKGANQ